MGFNKYRKETPYCDVMNYKKLLKHYACDGMVFSDFSRLLSIALSKGAKTTRQIWNLHSSAHDFVLSQQSSTSVITRKVFSSNLTHLALLFFFISGILKALVKRCERL